MAGWRHGQGFNSFWMATADWAWVSQAHHDKEVGAACTSSLASRTGRSAQPAARRARMWRCTSGGSCGSRSGRCWVPDQAGSMHSHHHWHAVFSRKGVTVCEVRRPWRWVPNNAALPCCLAAWRMSRAGYRNRVACRCQWFPSHLEALSKNCWLHDSVCCPSATRRRPIATSPHVAFWVKQQPLPCWRTLQLRSPPSGTVFLHGPHK